MEKANSMGCNSQKQQKFRQKKQLKDKQKTHVQKNVTLLQVSTGENVWIHIMLNRGKKLTNL